MKKPSLARVRVRPVPSLSTPISSPAPASDDLRDLRLTISYVPVKQLKRASRELRRRGKGQVDALATSIRQVGCVKPLLVTRDHELIDGHGVHEALLQLGYEHVPTIVVDHLSPGQLRALRLALNKLPEQSSWDADALAAELGELIALDPDLIAQTAFTMPEVDVVLADFARALQVDEEETAEPAPGQAVSRAGDLFTFAGGHKLLCGNAREGASYTALLGDERVQMAFTDPPYGCPVKGHVSRTHREFVEGSGLSEAEARTFFAAFLGAMTAHLQDGAIVDLCIDAGGMHALGMALREVGLVQKTICVWDKGKGGMGSLYRQQAEFVLVCKWGRGPHVNNVELGRHSRNRTTVWQAPGMAQFGRARDQALALHPTVKPVGLVADALLDTSRLGGLVLDPFLGSGTTLLAAHRTRRVGRGIELDPAYVDVAVRRMQAETGEPARHAPSGLTFDELAALRRGEAGQGADGHDLSPSEMV